MARTLEDLIYERMTAWPELLNKLAKYKGKAAVFYQNAPADTGGWKGAQQYPRIDYAVDMQANPERQTSGKVTINIWSIDSAVMPEEIEPEARKALCGIFMTPEGEPPYCLAWHRTDNFSADNEAERGEQIIGASMQFDVFAFPNQITSDPDPILAMNHFTKEWEPTATVIGHDRLDEYFEPQANEPVFYFRLVSLETSDETNTVAWMNGVIAGHVFAPTAEERLRWIRYLTDTLATRGEVIMLDTSPMRIRRLSADTGLDQLSQGQIRIQMRFGILRRAIISPLIKVNIQDQEADSTPKNLYVEADTTIEAEPLTQSFDVKSKLCGKEPL
jgi:hypothetical protein